MARASGYRCVDIRLTLRHDLDPVPDGGGARVRDASLDDIDAFRALAARSFHDTRFYHDPGFERERCDELYATWIEKGIRESSKWVLAVDIAGEPVGYQLITPAGDGGTARMEMLAVDEAHLGKGFGRALLAEGLRRAHEDGSVAVETATQERNEHSLVVHLALGFSVVRREIWHHKWYR